MAPIALPAHTCSSHEAAGHTSSLSQQQLQVLSLLGMAKLRICLYPYIIILLLIIITIIKGHSHLRAPNRLSLFVCRGRRYALQE